MEKTPAGTSVGVDDPYAHAGVCDFLTGSGTCRFAVDRPEADPGFAGERREAGYACAVGAEGAWADCPHYRSRSTDRTCARCGLEERRMGQSADRPLLEEHHLSYPDAEAGHEITLYLCRWCHRKVHRSWARIADGVTPDPEAIAALEGRRDRELDELAFRTAGERREG